MDSLISIVRYTEQECSICYNNFQEGEELYETVCKHLFHKDCLRPWLRHNLTCPNCRTITYTINANHNNVYLPLPRPPHSIVRIFAFSEHDPRPYSQRMVRAVKNMVKMFVDTIPVQNEST